jgi:hypothetical protein
MCGPLEIAYAAFNFLKADAEYKSAKATANSINENTKVTAQRIREESIYTDNELIRKGDDDVKVLAAKRLQVQQKAYQKEGLAKVSAGEKGIGGNVVDLIIGDIDRQEHSVYNTLDLNYLSVIRNNDALRQAENRKAANQILSLPSAFKPNALTFYGAAALNSAMFAASASDPDSAVAKGNDKIKTFFNG